MVWRTADAARPWGFNSGRNGRQGETVNLAVGACSVCGEPVWYQQQYLEANMVLVCWHCE